MFNLFRKTRVGIRVGSIVAHKENKKMYLVSLVAGDEIALDNYQWHGNKQIVEYCKLRDSKDYYLIKS